jgi:hypothetical protein
MAIQIPRIIGMVGASIMAAIIDANEKNQARRSVLYILNGSFFIF